MSHRLSILPLASVLGCVALAGGLSGCATSNSIEVTNVSDSWLNVQFFVGTPDTASAQSPELVADAKLQIEPGGRASYRLSRNTMDSSETSPLVHIRIEPVSPSWQSTGKKYWLELLTQPPTKIVATGTADKLMFNTGIGAVAIIPEREVKRGRFVYKMMADVPESPKSSH